MAVIIPCQRDKFDIPADITYLNCAYISPLMSSVQAAISSGVHAESQPWKITSADFYEPVEHARQLFANLINANADNITLIPAASYGLATASANCHLKAGQKILTLQDQYPSNVYTWHRLAKRCKNSVTSVQRPVDGDWTSAVLSSIDETIGLASLPNNHWMDGALLGLETIAQRLREVGARLVLDVTQSLGVVPLDVKKIKPDFLVCAGYKWLLCPYGIGFMYVADEFFDGVPIEESPHNRINGRDFPNMYQFEAQYVNGARRFDVGERANFSTLPGALAALQQLLDWDVENIQFSLASLTAEVAAQAEQLELDFLPNNRRANHFIGLRFPQGVPQGLTDTLISKNIFVSLRGDSLRVTPHLYNNISDIVKLFEVIAAFVKK